MDRVFKKRKVRENTSSRVAIGNGVVEDWINKCLKRLSEKQLNENGYTDTYITSGDTIVLATRQDNFADVFVAKIVRKLDNYCKVRQ